MTTIIKDAVEYIKQIFKDDYSGMIFFILLEFIRWQQRLLKKRLIFYMSRYSATSHCSIFGKHRF